uniref:Receptor-like protein kinase 2 n=1 Tax=Cajanus cajan TaxID=3821 RepID=A0A151QS54_CAJCA|nr:Receptor-like protein kinase 2 [Cajanus cajan]
MLVGEIPKELQGLETLRDFQIFNNRLSGLIPTWVGNWTNLRVFAAYVNHFNGRIPGTLGFISELRILNLHSNCLEGPIPGSIFSPGKLEVLILTQNNLSGDIPEEIGNCQALISVRIGNNNLVGNIPKSVGNLTSLAYFEADNNNLYGELVSEFSQCSSLIFLNLASNAFTGTIPPEFGQLMNLQVLILSGNRLFGNIPKSILRCKNLIMFDIINNRLNETIPNDICNISQLQNLLLGQNSIRGVIPPEIGSYLLNLEIGLNLSFNHLHGPLPPELGRLIKLTSLDVSSNHLSGNIPDAINGMYSLVKVNLSNNQLSGPLPDFGPLENNPASTFLSVTAVIFMIREWQELLPNDAAIEGDDTNNKSSIISGSIFVENLRQAVDLGAVVKATLNESNMLSSGTFSAVYKAFMPSGIVLLVRKLICVDMTMLHLQNKIIGELQRLSKLCNENLMQPIGYVIYNEILLLINQYLPNGTLAQLLHESIRQPGYQPDWPARLSIAIGVAKGLAYLHDLAIIHLDISSSNVLLDANFKPLIGEVEISKLLDPTKGIASISAVFGSIGYIPPEYAYTMRVTAPGNVYSFGVILLEILTCRRPVDEVFGEGVDLVKWVHGAAARGETPEQILDARYSSFSYGWRKQMLAALKLALLCTHHSPQKRPKMMNVVEMLREIGNNN